MTDNLTGNLMGKIAIVTGGLSGIGAAVVARMADQGAIVIAADLSSDVRSLGEGSISPFHVDVADPESVKSLFDAVLARYGRVDCVVNSAGIGKDIPFLDTSIDIFDKIIAINLRGTFIVGQQAARAMVQTGGGAIVNIASVSGMTGNVGRSAYGASKGGVVILSKVMAVDLAAHHIRVNVIAPGPVDTPLVAQMHPPAIRQRWTDRTPLGRYATPDEIAGAIVFLCSQDASYITGHVMAVDGGFLGSGLPV